MKRIPIMVLILLCAAQVFAQIQVGRTGVIKEISGTVELRRAGDKAFFPAKAGDPVAIDTVVSTGFKSSALITVGSSVLTVRPLTRLSLSEISASANTEALNVSLQTGRVRVDVNPPAGTRASMSIQSPTATASVRGTSFEFDTQSLKVLKGTVAFQGSRGQAMLVGAGTTSNISENGKSADPAQTLAVDLFPSPPAGNAAGFRRGASAPGPGIGGFDLTFALR